MAKIKAHRFTVTLDGQPRELLAVKERKSGDLQVFIRRNAHSTIVPTHVDAWGRPISKVGPENQIVESHISVHRLLLSERGGIKVQQTIQTSHHRQRWSTLIHDFGDESYFPLFLRFTGKISGPSYDHKASENDWVHHLGELENDDSAALVFWAVVSAGSDVPRAEFSWPPGSSLTVRFEHFYLHIGCSRVAIPGCNFGKTISALSAAATLNGVNMNNQEAVPLLPMTSSSAEFELEEWYRSLIPAIFQSVARRNFPLSICNIDPSVAEDCPRLPF